MTQKQPFKVNRDDLRHASHASVTQPDIRPVQESGNAVYVLVDDFVYRLPNGQAVRVPKGFRHDGASGAKFLFGRDGVHRAAALVHDYLIKVKGFIPAETKKDGDIHMTRKRVDRLFRAILEDVGVKSWHVELAYGGVRFWSKVIKGDKF